ncbi:glycosyl transferase [Pseudomonas sp. MWU13-2625]|nr:glycosyl transferase [Pseudomonas sp. MWU13-2625]
MRLVYLSPVPWASFAQRPQKFVRWFHEKTGGEVLWLEPYPSRFPCLADFRKMGVSDKTESDVLEPWLRVLKPRALPIEPLPGSGLLNKHLCWSEILESINKFSRDQEVMLVIGKPTTLALQVQTLLKDHRSIYDAMDDFPTFFSGMSKLAMTYRERKIGQTVDTVLASSTKLQKKWEHQNTNVKFVPNGLDVALLPPPKINVASRPTTFGYLGTVGAWFDWRWIIDLARSRPDDNVHIVGPVFNPSPVKLPDNLRLFPPCSHKEALATMLSFDVAVIPFIKNELTSSVDPIKYYEYRALGLPIISTGFGEMAYRDGQDGVYLCDSTADLNPLIEKALAYTTTKTFCDDFKNANSWETRFNAASVIAR